MTGVVMHELLLLRHAKSSWAREDVPDHERPLAPRGERAGAALRDHLSRTAQAPDLVLCSTARRAVDTWRAIAPAWPEPAAVEYDEELYGATTGELLRRLRRLPESARAVLVVGHNPGLGDLAVALVGAGRGGLVRRVTRKFPTGALATLTVPMPWTAIDWGTATIADYVVPRELPGGGDGHPPS